MGIAGNLKRALVAFALEVTCILFLYLAYLLGSGASLTGSTPTDALLIGFLLILFAFDYAIMSRHSSDEAGETEIPDQGPSPITKRERPSNI